MALIPMASPDITQTEINAVIEIMNTPCLSMGPRIEEFEASFANFIGTEFAAAVNSGTSGLHLALIASNIASDDLVITSSFSFIASSNVILYQNAHPIFVDVERNTGNIDPAAVFECTSDLMNGRTPHKWLPRNVSKLGSFPSRLKAILPVHAFGQPARMDEIGITASSSELAVIEDACEALGSEYNKTKVGLFGKLAVFAFYPNKQITTAEGGMVVTNDRNMWNLLRSLRNQGRDQSGAWLRHERLGFNYRLNEISAGIGIVQLQRIEDLLLKRSKVALWYSERLANTECLEIPLVVDSTTRMSWFVYVVRITPPARRDAVMQFLHSEDIPSRPYFSPIHLQRFYREKYGYSEGAFPNTEYLSNVCLALPFSSIMIEDQVDIVCGHLKKAIQVSMNKSNKSLPAQTRNSSIHGNQL
jgi:perosamine synthetase